MSGIGFQPVEAENDRLEAYPTAIINSKDPRQEFELIFDPNLSEIVFVSRSAKTHKAIRWVRSTTKLKHGGNNRSMNLETR